MIFYFAGIIYWGVLWGCASRAIAINRGYAAEGAKWFWLGFFFSPAATIVVATKPVNKTDNYNSAPNHAEQGLARKKTAEQVILENGGWRCSCGCVNAKYVSSCGCGRTRNEAQKTME